MERWQSRGGAAIVEDEDEGEVDVGITPDDVGDCEGGEEIGVEELDAGCCCCVC